MNSFVLHIIAMSCMLLDHIWHFGLINHNILNCIGRIAFPIFAFMIVEGYFKTKDLKKYILRLFIFALLSEIPFNLMLGGSVIYSVTQNVLWTFLIGIGLIWLMEKVKGKNIFIRALMLIFILFAGFILGLIGLTDYHYAGVFTVFVFYFFRNKKWYNLIVQIICLWVINTEILGGYEYLINVGNYTIHILRQSIAILGLIPIWLYNGNQGYYNKFIKYLYYSFYPLHLLVLWMISQII